MNDKTEIEPPVPGDDEGTQVFRPEDKTWVDQPDESPIPPTVVEPGEPDESIDPAEPVAGQWTEVYDSGHLSPTAADLPQAAQPPPSATTPARLSARLHKPAGAIFPGERVNAQLDLINQGGTAAAVMLQIERPGADWVSVQSSATVPALGRISVPVVINPPRDGTTAAGYHPLRVLLLDAATRRPLTAASADFQVATYEAYEATLQPVDVRHGQTANLNIANRGNAPVHLTVIGRDPSAAVLFEPPQAKLDLAVGQTASLLFKLKGAERPGFGQRDAYPFTLRIVSASGKEQRQRGTLTVSSRFGLPLLIGLIAALLLACAGTAYVMRDQLPFFSTGDTADENPVTPVVIVAATEAPEEVATVAVVEVATEPPPPTDMPVATDTPAAEPTESAAAAVETVTFGTSAGGIPLTYTRIGNGSLNVYLIGGLHAGYSPSSVRVVEAALNRFSSEPDLVPGSFSLILVTNLNPDAPLAAGELAGRYNANGVDLNRNWPCNWTADASVLGEVRPGTGGTSALSEPETSALADLYTELPPAVVIAYFALARDGLVTPGRCAPTSASSDPATIVYADASGFRLDDLGPRTGVTLTGDMTDWLDSTGVPAISVVLPDRNSADWSTHQPALQAIFDSLQP